MMDIYTLTMEQIELSPLISNEDVNETDAAIIMRCFELILNQVRLSKKNPDVETTIAFILLKLINATN
jgi:hypothetical protein